jgi:hypothetical protein
MRIEGGDQVVILLNPLQDSGDFHIADNVVLVPVRTRLIENEREAVPGLHSGCIEPSLDGRIQAGSVSFFRMEVDDAFVFIATRVVEIDF